MAKKVKTEYICTDCGARFPRWTGKCGECQAWNTLEERLVQNHKNTLVAAQEWQHADPVDLLRLEDISYQEQKNILNRWSLFFDSNDGSEYLLCAATFLLSEGII